MFPCTAWRDCKFTQYAVTLNGGAEIARPDNAAPDTVHCEALKNTKIYRS